MGGVDFKPPAFSPCIFAIRDDTPATFRAFALTVTRIPSRMPMMSERGDRNAPTMRRSLISLALHCSRRLITEEIPKQGKGQNSRGTMHQIQQ